MIFFAGFFLPRVRLPPDLSRAKARVQGWKGRTSECPVHFGLEIRNWLKVHSLTSKRGDSRGDNPK